MGAGLAGRGFLPGVLAIVLPVMVLTAASHYLLLETVARFEGAMDHTVGLMVPVVSLHGEMMEALIPPHDFLLNHDPEAADHLERAGRRVDTLLAELREVGSLSPEDRNVLASIQADWGGARNLAQEIVGDPNPLPPAAETERDARLDLQMDRAITQVDTLFDRALRDLDTEWRTLRRHTHVQLAATGLLSLGVVGMAIAAGVAVLRMARALQESEARFAHLARHDPLTGLENRQAFHRRLAEELERARRFGRPCGLIMLDVDHFKAVNDTHGHPAGDEALRRIAGVLCRQVRRIDQVARYGGEEFVMLLPETGAEGTEALAERIRAGISAHPIPLGAELERTITVSLGVATYPADAESAADLVRAADQALYAAKHAGRDRVARAAGGAAPRV